MPPWSLLLQCGTPQHSEGAAFPPIRQMDLHMHFNSTAYPLGILIRENVSIQDVLLNECGVRRQEGSQDDSISLAYLMTPARHVSHLTVQ